MGLGLDRTVGLGPDRTGPICKQSGPEFWDWTEVRSYGPVQSGLSYGPVFIFETGLCTVPKTYLHIVGIADKSNV